MLGLALTKFSPKKQYSSPLSSLLPTIREESLEPKSKDFGLVINKLKVNAPVVADVDAYSEKEYYAKLRSGVAHFKGTAKPDQNKGNIFIFGHSGFYKNDPGEYKEVFRKLDELKKDDQIHLWWKEKDMVFKVTENKVVAPDDFSVIEQTKDLALTLMTCWPPDTIDKRRVVVAKPL
ncbi:sortase [Candidatus Berkelbacteria bacterium]|nr:sortase [Candidatus Berkelbacteria bacterium]MBI4029870.1 sortase [Candidatus Berkelbacteria bacterium]